MTRSTKPSSTRSTKSSSSESSDSMCDLEIIGQGGSGLVFSVTHTTVIKVPIPSPFGLQAFQRERDIYQRFRKRPSEYVVECRDTEHSSGLFLERCVESVRSRLRRMRSGDNGFPKIGDEDALALTRRWAYQAAEGLAYVHSQRVIQADVGCHNMLLDRRDDLKLADFSGSSITDMPDCPALVTYDTRSRLPNIDEPNRASDLFALGSAIYEMATGDLPYPSLPAREVQRLFFQREFPNLDRPGICPAIAQVIRRCWLVDTPAGFKSTKEVARELRCYYSGKTNREPRVAETTPTAAKTLLESLDGRAPSLFR
ncbi:hypothetical protein PG999_014551 [Apiospora kogelbergensis]|uniref:Protein kinase domain-containing protein n=1 Tax=Apiospora kogelbergensis TaxID=1337665 RepID=A0AAW0Q579_9PEZI